MCEEFENEKKKRTKNFDLPERGFEPQIFSNFPAHDEFSWEVRKMRSNVGTEVKISRLYESTKFFLRNILKYFFFKLLKPEKK